MASRKKQPEGIALLSMYNDDDDEDMEHADEEQQEEHHQHEQDEQQPEQNEATEFNVEGHDSFNSATITGDLARETMAAGSNHNSTPKEILMRPPTPQDSFSSSPQQHQHQHQHRIVSSERRRHGRGRLTIVDYGHDEVAMSPEPEEGEFDEELQAANSDGQERTPSGTVEVSAPNVCKTSLSSEPLQSSLVDEMNIGDDQSENPENEGNNNIPAVNDYPLDKFLSPPPKEKCPEELQIKIDRFIAYKKSGRSFNDAVRNKKDFRNPDFLQHAVRYQEVDEIGSCFSKDVFDPYGYDSSDFYDAIEVDMRREKERKEQELKKSPKVDFVSGGTQPGQVIPPSKFSLRIAVASAVPSGLHSASTTGDAVVWEGRQKKKSKWDKVDGDGRNPLPTGGHDSSATAAAHAAILSAANVGAGYPAFVQQKRREAEERRSSEKKLERRS